MKPLAIVGAVLGGLVLIALIVVGGWRLGWWAKQSAANHNAHIYQQSYGAQEADIQQVQQLISETNSITVQIKDPSTPATEITALRAQYEAETTQACNVANQINPDLMTPDVSQWVAGNCA